MSEVKILIYNKNATESVLLEKLCRRVGAVDKTSSIEEIIFHVESKSYDIAVIDHTLANYITLQDLFAKSTSIVITGHKEKKVKEVIHGWPRDYYVDYYTSPFQDWEDNGFLRILKTATEYSKLQNEVKKLRTSNEHNQEKLKEAFSQIKDINTFIQETVLAELGKRISLEARYFGLKKKRQKIEDVLKKLYIAKDITSLIDIVHDIKEIVKVHGISIYILDENETLGEFLKPLVWDDAILSYPDFTKYIVPLHSHDFAAESAREAAEISTNAPSSDSRFSSRYSSRLDYPLDSILCMPIMHDSEVIGVLEVYNKTAPHHTAQGFTEEDQQILREFCEHMAIAITKLNLIQYDALTGLLRPEPFFEKVIQKLRQESKRRQEEASYALVMGDVDWFKNYNDKQGHSAGNKLLRELAGLLKSSMREEDLLCRYGGEEFLFFLTSIQNKEESYIITERLRRKVSEHYFDGQEVQPRHNLTMSFGITSFTKERFKSPEMITHNVLKKLADEADMALAVAKGKRKETHFQEEVLEAESDKNNISIYAEKPTEKPKSTDVIMTYDDFTPKQTEEKTRTGKKDFSASGKNRIRFFSGTPAEEMIKTEIISRDLISNSQDRRKFRRFRTSNLVVYSNNGNEKVTKAIDLSLGGARIRTEDPLSEEELINLVFIFGNKAFKSKGDVVYSIKEGAQPFYSSGIKFKDFTHGDREILQDYLTYLCMGKGTPTEQ